MGAPAGAKAQEECFEAKESKFSPEAHTALQNDYDKETSLRRVFCSGTSIHDDPLFKTFTISKLFVVEKAR